MTESKRKTPPQGIQPPNDDDDVYAILAAAPARVPEVDRRIEELLSRHQREPDASEKPPPLPATFLSGILRFPWYLQSLGPWVLCSIGLTLSLLGVVLGIWLVDNGLTMAAYAMRFSICWIIAFAWEKLTIARSAAAIV